MAVAGRLGFGRSGDNADGGVHQGVYHLAECVAGPNVALEVGDAESLPEGTVDAGKQHEAKQRQEEARARQQRLSQHQRSHVAVE